MEEAVDLRSLSLVGRDDADGTDDVSRLVADIEASAHVLTQLHHKHCLPSVHGRSPARSKKLMQA